MKKRGWSMIVIVIVSIVSALSTAYGQPLAFPDMETTAKVGEYVLAANQNAAEITPTETVIFYTYEMIEPGEVESKIKDPFDERTVPNSLIIPLPKGQTAEVGDIVLTWWQSGSGMKRAYVVNADNPKEPVVKYIDIAYDNPATGKDDVPIGQMDEQLKPDSFVKLDGDFAPGSAVAVKDPKWDSYNHYQVVHAVGDQVIVLGFAGKMNILNKADCFPVSIMPKVKAGQEVYVNSMSSFTKAIVKKVDLEMGRVFTEEDAAIAFGDVINPVQMAQDFLTRLGYDPGPVDGAMGSKTEAAIRAFQQEMNMSEDGQPSLELLAQLYFKLSGGVKWASQELAVIFDEDFNDNSREWYENDDEECTIQVDRGFYVFDHKRAEGSWYTWQKVPIDAQKDFSIETTISKVDGLEKFGYGLLWGLKDINNFYEFCVSPNGYYRVAKEVDGEWSALIKWTASDAVSQGNATNILKVEKSDDQLNFFVNGHYLDSIDFQEFLGEKVGFLVYKTMKLEIDQIVVKN
jgi:peptidoglycan hydrolase-like protein with peptidoglycan-binding domain